MSVIFQYINNMVTVTAIAISSNFPFADQWIQTMFMKQNAKEHRCVHTWRAFTATRGLLEKIRRCSSVMAGKQSILERHRYFSGVRISNTDRYFIHVPLRVWVNALTVKTLR